MEVAMPQHSKFVNAGVTYAQLKKKKGANPDELAEAKARLGNRDSSRVSAEERDSIISGIVRRNEEFQERQRR
jgi:hypothetical protein